MIEKINKIMMNVVTFVLIALLLFVPMFVLEEGNGDLVFQSKTIFGFHFITGLTISNPGADGIEQFSQVLQSKLLGVVPIAMLLSMFIIDKVSKVNLGKSLVNFLCMGVVFVYTFLLPITSSNFIAEFYRGHLYFTRIWSFWVVLTLIGLVFIYYTVILILKIRQSYKKLVVEESAKEELTSEAKKEDESIQ